MTPPLTTTEYEDIPYPVLLNVWKHHAGAIRHRLRQIAGLGEQGLQDLSKELVVIGMELMDLYTGELSPRAIALKVIAHLQAAGLMDLASYQAFLASKGGYDMITFSEDNSGWVLRLGEEAGRYVHVHPGRWVPCTRRVRANVLKTAIMVRAYVAVHGGKPRSVPLVNQVRKQYLGFSPIGKLSGGEGLDVILDILDPVLAGV